MAGFALGKVFVDFEIALGRLTVAVLNMLPITFLFLGLSLWASARLPSRSMAAMLITGVIVLAYFLQILGDAAPILQTARKLSPFYWAEPSRVIVNGFNWTRSFTLLAAALFSTILAIRSFEFRDIATGAREWHLPKLRKFPVHR